MGTGRVKGEVSQHSQLPVAAEESVSVAGRP